MSRTFDSVRGTVDSLREPLVDDLKALHDTLEDARGAIGSVQGVVRTNEDDFAETMRALRTASENLRTMTEQLKAAPVEPDSDNAVKRSEGAAMRFLLPSMTLVAVFAAGCGGVRYPRTYTLDLAGAAAAHGATGGPWRARRSRLQLSGLPFRRPNRVSADAHRSRVLTSTTGGQ